jgi:hypothetical protein
LDSRYADPAVWLNAAVDIYVRLEELHPGDPGEASGAELRFSENGEYSTLGAYMGSHCLGLLDGSDLVEFLGRSLNRVDSQAGADGGIVAELCELYPQLEPRRPSGAHVFCGGGGLSLWFGQHCFGVIADVTTAEDFLRRAWMRATTGTGLSGADPRKVVSITAGARKCARC